MLSTLFIKQTNKAAHELAHAVPLATSSQLFLDVSPYINDLLANEMS